MAIVSMSAMVAFLCTFREWRKYHFILCVLNCMHYYCAASKPTLYYQSTPLTKQLLEHCSLLVEKYHPTWFLFNGHLQTIFLALGSRFPVVTYSREYVHLADGGLVSLDWAIPPTKSTSYVEQHHDQPTVLLLHGTCGGSWENYIRKAADKLMEHGWRVVVMNARGCAKTPVLTPRLFNAADTDDIRQVVTHLRRKHAPTAPLLAVGFSLGSNLLVKFLGEERDKCALDAAVSVGNPFDAMEIYRHLHHSSLATHLVYYRAMTKRFLKLFFEESNVHEHFADHPTVDIDKMKKCDTMWDVDHAMTLKVFGYKSVVEYYRDCSSAPYLPHVRIPLLCLSAKDDPVCVSTAIPVEDCLANKHVILAVTERGGHLGFYTGDGILSYPDTWSAKVVAQYCDAMRDIVVSRTNCMSPSWSSTGHSDDNNPIERLPAKVHPVPQPRGPLSPVRFQHQNSFPSDLVDELELCDGVPLHRVFSFGAAVACAYFVKKVELVATSWRGRLRRA
ncbi:hypothetical protein H310_04958 [Aphanomyces invadans]|uniref:AB hydrolase-1 domain-containing protein n=1 Tax=Aphanomyces invadans TaxID=157072 RepID=A0A024UCA9_9STRA|nr:hypothetical protein H310_04958 [Aphanomyces invadans]ETW03517.1 hypothetical protein H310_04958 [Aphanomyces invadans]|eukprot:XP_008867746.1 hypothetical protein H310_04958 [Aphanomyces invadans]